MAGEPFSKDKFHRPELFLSDLLRKSARGQLVERGENPQVLYRVLVAAVDVEGGRLENPDGAGSVKHVLGSRHFEAKANVGPKNPRNSIKGRIISDGYDQFARDEGLRVFWPFFPEHVSIPIKPGEHAYVLFEDEELKHGLWVSKVSGHENVNYFRGQDSFKTRSSLGGKFGDVPDAQELNTDEDAGESKPQGNLKNIFGD